MPSNIELLRRLVHQQLTKLPGPVGNFYGAVAGQSPPLLVEQTQRFLVAQIPGTRLLSPEEFYANYTAAQTRNYQVLQATDGVIVAESITLRSNTPSTFLIRSVTENPGQITLPLTIETDSPTSEFAVYIDGVLQRRGNGRISMTLTLGAGRRLLEIVAVARVFGLAVPPSVRFYYDLETVPTPVWSTIRTGYVDPVLGTVALELEWYNDTRVGGWIVFRRQLTYLSQILSVGPVDANGEFVIELDGDQTAAIIVSAAILAGAETMGTVISALYDELAPATMVRIKIVDGRSASTTDWVGRIASVGQFAEQARVRRNTKGGAITWTDLSVSINGLYEYVLQAFGLFDEMQLSALSEIRRVVPGDVQPPSSIVFEPGYPLANLDLVTAKFTTPPEPDYEGVRVMFYDKPSDGFGTASALNSATTLVCDTRAWEINQFADYLVRITGGTGSGQVATILSNTTNQLNLSPTTPWVLVPDDTSTFEIYRLVNIITDYGIPSTKDETRFSSVGFGRYYFCTFDRAQNIQPFEDAAYWDYDNVDDQLTPLTNVLVYDRTWDGKQSQTIFGMTLYSIPPATEIIADTFEELDGTGFALLDSGTFAETGNTTRIFSDPSKNWVANGFVGKWVRIYSEGADFNRILQIDFNGPNVLVVQSDAALPPNGLSYQILEHAPNRTPTATEYWQLSDADKITIKDSAVQFVGVAGDAFHMWIDSAHDTKFRYEAVLTRGPYLASGDNSLTYKADATHAYRFEYGLLQESETTVTLRYRYNSGGAGAWNTLLTGVQWPAGSANTLIVEVDGVTHTFRMADAFGHDERNVGRLRLAGTNPDHTYLGWTVHGKPTDGVFVGDGMDSVRVLDFDTLVRIKYKLLPYEDPVTRRGEFLAIPHWTGTALSGNVELLTDNTKLWSRNELVGAWIRISDGPAAGSDVEILANTETAIVPKTPFDASITPGNAYTVYEKYYTGTERLRWWATRLPKQPQYLLYHGERLNAPDEPENRLLIDPNSVPEIYLTLSQVEPFEPDQGTLLATVIPDDDVATYRLLLRKGNWPAFDTITDPPDPPDGPGPGGDPAPDPPTALRTVNVTTAAELETALGSALPGDKIVLAAGTYTPTGADFVVSPSGTAANPIVVSGPSTAIISGGAGFRVTGDFVYITGLTITAGSVGVSVQGADHVVLDTLDIHDVAGTGIEFIQNTTSSFVQSCTFADITEYGVKIGDGATDACNDNRVLQNTFNAGIVLGHVCIAQSVSASNVIQENTCDATGTTGDGILATQAGTSNGMFRNNVITNINSATTNGIYVYRATGNRLTLNNVSGTSLHFGFNINDDSVGSDNILYCDNTGTSNVACTEGDPPNGPPQEGSKGTGVGPTGLPLDENTETLQYTGSVAQPDNTPATFLSDLKNASAKGWKRFFAVFQKAPSTFANADGTFNMNLYKDNVDRYIGIYTDLKPFIDSGYLISYVIDEPYHSKWKGSITGNMLKEMCDFHEQCYPGIIKVLRMDYSRFVAMTPTGGWAGVADYGWAQYSHQHVKMSHEEYYTQQKAGFKSLGLDVILGLNWFHGGDGSSGIVTGQDSAGKPMYMASPDEVIDAANAAFKLGTIYFGWWTHISDVDYLQPFQTWWDIEHRSDYQAAFKYAIDLFAGSATMVAASSSTDATTTTSTTTDPITTLVATDTVTDDPSNLIPDPRYTKYLGNTDFRNQAYQVDNGWWYGAAIPYDTNGSPGPVSWAKVEIRSTPGDPPAGDALSIVTQPPSVTPNAATLNPAPVVQLMSGAGDTLAIAGVFVSVALKSGTVGLTGTVTVSTDSNGQATFGDLQLTGQSGAADILVFSANGYTSVESIDITIDTTGSANPTLSIDLAQPDMVEDIGEPWWVRLRDTSGAPILTAGVSVTAMTFDDDLIPSTGGYLLSGDPIASPQTYSQSPSVTVQTDAQGIAKFMLKLSGSAPGTERLLFVSSGYDSKLSPTINVQPRQNYALTNIRADFRRVTRTIDGPFGPQQSTYKALTLYWGFPEEFKEPDTRGVVDIFWRNGRNATQYTAVTNYPVWKKFFTTLTDTLGGPVTPELEGNYAFGDYIQGLLSGAGNITQWQTVHWLIQFKVSGVVKFSSTGSISFYGTVTTP